MQTSHYPQSPAFSPNESARLATLRRLGLCNAEAEPGFDRVTRLASRFLKASVALVTFVEEHEVFSASCHGQLDDEPFARPTPRAETICSIAITSPDPLIIPDTRAHPQIKDNRAVLDRGVLAYLGIPLVTTDGLALGVLCVVAGEPRAWTTDEVETLRDLAGAVMVEIQLRAEIAERTRAEEERVESLAALEANRRAERILSSITDGFVAIDRDWRFTYINAQAEQLLRRQSDDLVGKVFGDEFPDIVGSQFEREQRRVVRTGQPADFEAYFAPLDAWFEVHSYPSGDDGLAIYFRDVTERRKIERQIREAEERFRILLEGARDHALILMDVDGTILDWQGGAERILGWTKAEAIGRHGSMIFTPDDRAQGVDAREFARAAEAGIAADVRWHLKKDGVLFFADGVMTRLNDSCGKARGFAKVLQDATARKLAEDSLQSQGEALRQADLRKNEFLAMLAHELRNPLAAIRNALGVARSGTEADLQWGLAVIDRQLRGFAHLIDDLLDASRITQGKIQLRKRRCDAGSIIRQAAESVTPLVEQKGHRLTLSLPDGPLPLEADPIRLEQILVNVLGNAAKYTPPQGRIDLIARVEADQVTIRIKDNGVGIAPDQLPQMFELFAQADRSLARSEGGLGIGLTLVRSLTEMHGGTITATSAGKNRGSEFIIRLPAATASPVVAPSVEPSPTTPAVGPKRKVLVVDDNQDTARGMARLLKIAGHEVQVAHDGWTAIELAREFTPEAVLLDIGLPGLDGYEVAARLRRESACPDALLIAASGYGEDQARDRSRQAGFNHHLTKPVDFAAITTLLSQPMASG